MLDRLQARFGRWAIPHLGLAIVLAQVLVWVAVAVLGDGVGDQYLARLALDPAAVQRGELWRLVSFIFVPPDAHPVFLIFGWLFLWFACGAIETRWGAFRFNAYLAVGWLATLAAVAFGHHLLHLPGVVGDASWYLVSVFLAFAWLYPDHLLYVLFIIPLKAKWMALVTWVILAVSFLNGGAWTRLMVAAVAANFLVFFAADLRRWLGRRGRGAVVTARAAVAEDRPFHRCAGCGASERSHPDRRFRVCTDCRPAADWCDVCLKDHHH